MHFTLLKKDYFQDEPLMLLNPTNGIAIDTYSSNTEASVILMSTNSDLSKKEFIEVIDNHIKSLQDAKKEAIQEYDKLKKLKMEKLKSI